MIDCLVEAALAPTHVPHGKPRFAPNRRGRNCAHNKPAAAAATMLRAMISCQSMAVKYRFSLEAQLPRSASALHRCHQSNKPPLENHFFLFPFKVAGSNPAMSEIFRHTRRVTYADCTVGNHVYYARYLDLLEEARGEFFRHAGMTLLALQEQDTIFPVVEVQLKYKAPARYDDVLAIEVWLTELGKIRVHFGSRILNQQGVILLEGETRHVCTSLHEKPKRVPEALAERLKPFLRLAE